MVVLHGLAPALVAAVSIAVTANLCDIPDEPRRAEGSQLLQLERGQLLQAKRGHEQGHHVEHAQLEYQCDEVNRAPCSVCGRESPRCDYHLFEGKIEGPWIPCCEKMELMKMLAWFNDIVQPHIDTKGNGFWYSLAFGSLLGSTRSGDMIDWDTDIDIAVPKDHLSWLTTLLQERVADVDPPYYVVGGSVVRLQMSQTNKAHIDIWPAEGIKPDEPCAKIGTHVSANHAVFPLQECAMGNMQIPCFHQRDEYLKSWYGIGWNSTGTSKKNAAPEPLPVGCQLGLLQPKVSTAQPKVSTAGQ